MFGGNIRREPSTNVSLLPEDADDKARMVVEVGVTDTMVPCFHTYPHETLK